MLNQCIIVGRIIEIMENPTIIKVAVSRSYKNENGEYDTDIIAVNLDGPVAARTLEYCSKGDMIGIKGRLENKDSRMALVAEKISFLSSRAHNDDEIDNN